MYEQVCGIRVFWMVVIQSVDYRMDHGQAKDQAYDRIDTPKSVVRDPLAFLHVDGLGDQNLHDTSKDTHKRRACIV